MAVSGTVMILFLLLHMIGNLKIFLGRTEYDTYADWLRHIGSPAVPYRTVLTIIEVVLTIAVVVHIWSAVSLSRRAHEARPVKYVAHRRVQQSYASRTMRWGGVIVALFVIYHLLDLTANLLNPHGKVGDPYGNVVADFKPDHWYATLVYLIALIAVGAHLRHGVWSACATLGANTKTRQRFLNVVATAVAVIIAGGFMAVPLAVLFGGVR